MSILLTTAVAPHNRYTGQLPLGCHNCPPSGTQITAGQTDDHHRALHQSHVDYWHCTPNTLAL